MELHQVIFAQYVCLFFHHDAIVSVPHSLICPTSSCSLHAAKRTFQRISAFKTLIFYLNYKIPEKTKRLLHIAELHDSISVYTVGILLFMVT